MNEKISERQPMLTISWRRVSIAASLLALGAVVSLVFVASVRQVETLSVVALGLAVVAFVTQIITYTIQSDAAARQERDATAINGSTLRSLALIEEKAEATRHVVNSMNERVLTAMIEKARVEEAVVSDPSEESAEGAIAVSRKLSILRDQFGDSSTHGSTVRDLWERTEDESMKTVPTGKALKRALGCLESLASKHFWTIRWLGRDQLNNGGRPDSPLLGVSALARAKELYTAGLVRRVQRGDQKAVFVLSDLGKDVARILLSEDDSLLQYPIVVEARREIALSEKQQNEIENAMRNHPEIPIES